MNPGNALCAASWLCFVLGAAMLKSPSPLLLGLFPAQFCLGLAALYFARAKRSWLAATAALLALNWAFLFKQAFLS